MRVASIILIAGCGFQAQAVVTDASASSPDASFTYAQCPASYAAALPGPSRYRLIIEGAPAWSQSDACAGDMPGATHLVVLETLEETTAVAALVGAPPMGIAGNAVWVGGVQPRSALQPRDGWLRFDGEPLTSGWSGGEPNDRGGNEAEHDEQFVRLERGKLYLQDSAGSVVSGALCECDGKAIAPNAADALAANRPPT